ncbi:MAG: hypothetical protein U0796_14975 [Gemmatales bacterium]
MNCPSVAITASGGDEEFRKRRLGRVEAWLQREYPGAVRMLRALHDHKGNLAADWREFPTEARMGAIVEAWEAVDESASCVSHTVDGTAVEAYTRPLDCFQEMALIRRLLGNWKSKVFPGCLLSRWQELSAERHRLLSTF